MNHPKPLTIHKLISTFLTAGAGIQRYLKRRGPLSPTQQKSISLAVSLIQFYLEHDPKKALGIHTRKAAALLGKLGGLHGGKARAKKLSARKRTAIAKLAASARWGKKAADK